MTLDLAVPWVRTVAARDELVPEMAGETSSLRNSSVHVALLPADTVSLPEVGVSVRENRVIVSLTTARELMPAKWLAQTVVELARLLQLPRDWNSDGAKRIQPKAIEKMQAILMTILDADSAPPAVVPTTRGGAQVEWHRSGIDLEIEALSSGKAEFFFCGPQGEQEGPIEGDLAALKTFTRYLKATPAISGK